MAIDLANKTDGTGALEALAQMGGLSGGVKAHYISTAASLETAPLSVVLFFKATSATAIAKALGNGDKAPPSHLDGPVSLTVDISGNAADASMTALLKTAQGNVKLDGSVKDAMGKPTFALVLDAGAPAYRSFMSSLGLPYDKAAPVGALSLKGRVHGSTEELVVDEIAFKAGENAVSGTMTANLSAALVRPQITASLNAGTMNLDALMPRGSSTQKVEKEPGGKTASAGPPWSDDPLPLEGLKAADMDVRVTAKLFLGFGVLFEDADMHFVLQDGTARVEKFTGQLYGGPMDMKGSFGPQQAQGQGNSVPMLDMAFTLSQSNMGTMVKTMTGRESVTGIMDANFTLQGAGATSRSLVRSLSGTGAINGKDGAFIGFDVSALVKAVKNIDNPGGFASLLGAALGGGQTKYNDLDLGFDIQNGVMKTKEARTDLAQAEMRLNAVIDLPRWLLDSRADIVLEKNPNLPPVGMKFFGPLDQPKRKVDTDSLTRYAAEKAIAAGVSKLFGGGKKKQPEAPENGPMETQDAGPPSQEPQQPDPAKVLQQLFGK
ncbi:MAG: AsmA family protein [Alphaproteobacteria bacterium]